MLVITADQSHLVTLRDTELLTALRLPLSCCQPASELLHSIRLLEVLRQLFGLCVPGIWLMHPCDIILEIIAYHR